MSDTLATTGVTDLMPKQRTSFCKRQRVPFCWHRVGRGGMRGEEHSTDVFEELSDVVQEAPEEQGALLALCCRCAQSAHWQRGARARTPSQARDLQQQQQQHGAGGICVESRSRLECAVVGSLHAESRRGRMTYVASLSSSSSSS